MTDRELMGFFAKENIVRRNVPVREVVLGTAAISLPLLLFFAAMIWVSLSPDLDTRVLIGEVVGFSGVMLLAMGGIVAYVRAVLINRKTKKYEVLLSGYPWFLVVVAAVGIVAGGIHINNALKDFYAPDEYITGVFGEYVERNESRRIFILKGDSKEYSLINQDVDLTEGNSYMFRYYRNIGRVYMLEEIKE